MNSTTYLLSADIEFTKYTFHIQLLKLQMMSHWTCFLERGEREAMLEILESNFTSWKF